MIFLDKIFGKKDKPPKIKQFKFATIEVEKAGDVYNYTIDAENAEEAEKLLMLYFFGNNNKLEQIREKVKSNHSNIFYPAHFIEAGVRSNNIFSNYGARMFAMKISGYSGRPEVVRWFNKRVTELNIAGELKS